MLKFHQSGYLRNMNRGTMIQTDTKPKSMTVLYNEWVCVAGQYEKTLVRLGRQLFQAYKDGTLSDEEACEFCQIMDGVFQQAKSERRELTHDVERRLFQGLTLSESVSVNGTRDLKKVDYFKLRLKVFFSRRVTAVWDERNMSAYRETIKDVVLDLGNRALACWERRTPLLDEERDHPRLCQLALRLEKDAKQCWEEIVRFKERSGDKGAVSFRSLSVNFVLSFGSYFRKSRQARRLLHLCGYNDAVETAKLRARYAGKPEGETLRELLENPN